MMTCKKYKVLLLTVSISLIVSILLYIWLTNFSSAKRLVVNYSTNQLKKKRHVFLDLGTNNGDSVRFFIDKAERNMQQSFLKGYGALDNKTWEIYAIEANPYFNEKLSNLKSYCESLGHSFNLLTETAAWTKNEKLVFYLDTVNTNYDYWGSSLIKEHPDVVSSGFKNVTVDGIDISELLKKYTHDDEIVMKIDIEGAEYDLLLHLIKDATLHLVDIIAIEYHKRLLKPQMFSHDALENFFNEYFMFYNIRFVPWF